MKKKVSSKDFLDLLDEQEVSKDRIAFKPQKKNKRSGHINFQLSPMQKELIDLALKHSPKFVTNIVESKRTKKLLDLIQTYSATILNK